MGLLWLLSALLLWQAAGTRTSADQAQLLGLEETAVLAFKRLKATAPEAANGPVLAQAPRPGVAHAAASSLSAAAASQPTGPLRILMHLGLSESTYTAAEMVLLVQTMNEACTFHSKALNIKSPVQGNLLFSVSEEQQINDVFAGHVTNLKVPEEFVAGKGNGAPADVLVMLVNPADVGWSCNGDSSFTPAAGSATIWFDQVTGRSKLGIFIACPGLVDPAYIDTALKVVVHELVHILGFSNSLLKKALDPSQFYQGINAYGKPAWYIATPGVVGWARGHFGCSSITALPLEDEGGGGTAGSHWEQTLFADDFMVGINNKATGLTNLTLHLLEDLGWYLPNYGVAATSNWGAAAGCGFFNSTCFAYMQRNQSQRNWCALSASSPVTSCTYDGRGLGRCMALVTSNGCLLAFPTSLCWQVVPLTQQMQGYTPTCVPTYPGSSQSPRGAACVNVRCSNGWTWVNGSPCQPGQMLQANARTASGASLAWVTCPLLDVCSFSSCGCGVQNAACDVQLKQCFCNKLDGTGCPVPSPPRFRPVGH